MIGPLGGLGPLGRGAGGGGGGGDTVIDAGGATVVSLLSGGSVTVTNAPDAVTEINENRRLPVNWAGRTTAQLGAGGTAAGGAGSLVHVRYSLTNGASWVAFPTPLTCPMDTLAAGTSPAIGTAVAIPAEAQTDILISPFTDGDATPTEDPVLVNIFVVVV